MVPTRLGMSYQIRGTLRFLSLVSSDLKSSLQTLMTETQRQAESHIRLAFNIRRELVEPTARFHEKQIERKRVVQTPVEKKLKAKQSQASYVATAREKYEGDLARIKTYKQQAAAMQGLEAERLQVKLRRALETVKANEKDYASFVRGLSDLSAEWEADWKAFSDDCQDLEEERMEFMKDNIWNYANMISTICVNDDEVRIRVNAVPPPNLPLSVSHVKKFALHWICWNPTGNLWHLSKHMEQGAG